MPASFALRAIAAEERIHDRLMHQLAASLPPASPARAIRAARIMHLRLSTGGAAAHLGRIAALDAAVCTILSRLLRPGLPITADPLAHRLLSHVRRDEARHVALARKLALAGGVSAALRDDCADARCALAAVLAIETDAFEALEVDPDTLIRDVCRLPDGLLAS